MRLFLSVTLLLLAVPCSAQTELPAQAKVVFKISLATKQIEFHIGEIIPVQLAFSSEVNNRYQINRAQYDRSGRMNYEEFKVLPADGAEDPLPTYKGSMGGLTSYEFLTKDPWTIGLNLNEWIRFTRPGKYRLMIVSNRVAVRDRSSQNGTRPLQVTSNEIALTIIEADDAWQKSTYKQAVATLNVPAPAKPSELDKYFAARRQAADTLRFLGTRDAIREMANRTSGKSDENLEYVFSLGLIATPDREFARDAMSKALADPDQPIDSHFLYTLRRLSSPLNDQAWRDQAVKTIEQLINVLPEKRGKALAISLNTAVNEAWNVDALPKSTLEVLAKQLLSMFDQLPMEQRNQLLGQHWDKISSPALIPLLKRYATAYRDYPEMRESNAYDSLELSANALVRWYELDPTNARPAVIAEIMRPRPRYGARVLGILPDENLPEVDAALAEHLASSEDLDGGSNLASLIARYATNSIEAQVLDQLDSHLGKWACAIQNPLLGYALRVDPVAARPRIEKAIALRGEHFTGCNQGVLGTAAKIHFDPLLEELAIPALDDPDPQVAMSAANLLGTFGSAAARPALWRRYADWTAKWAGHEDKFQIVSGDPAYLENMSQLGLGQTLAQALTSGKSWLTDKTILERMLEMTD
ncbi:MAG TPA: hypothetical protein VKB46_10840, partial [Pyrinomonadaceae bacterium]|nr:hypothetical protein [Pyrinomonadaceae bacterium]